ncbi:MAG: hypothetical protein A2169_10125 [Deltaproteobacteria bacterium RBG_13_47_9]|nr:MAG: hypothetical protein A2169_10125 [Deltaproteobacteria bacterium RBG_13_47_9]
MDKVFSTRMDDDLVKTVNRIARQKSISKKALVEKALRTYIEESGSKSELDVIERTFGTWKRDEAFDGTWKRAKRAFEAGMKRHSIQKERK